MRSHPPTQYHHHSQHYPPNESKTSSYSSDVHRLHWTVTQPSPEAVTARPVDCTTPQTTNHHHHNNKHSVSRSDRTAAATHARASPNHYCIRSKIHTSERLQLAVMRVRTTALQHSASYHRPQHLSHLPVSTIQFPSFQAICDLSCGGSVWI